MDFFEGQQISCCGSFPEHSGTIGGEPVYYGVQYNYSGKFFLRINGGRELRGEGPCAFITRPGIRFEYGTVDGGLRHHSYVCSHGPRLARYIDSGLLPLSDTSPLLPVGDPERFLQTIIDICALMRRAVDTPARAVLLYEDLLLQLHEERRSVERLASCRSPQLRHLAEAIRARPQSFFDWEKEARALHVSPGHFRRLFRNFSGLPPQQYLIQCRLQLAARLLQESSLPVNEVAEASGIGGEFYFSRLFRQKYRVSPTGYRRGAVPLRSL